MLYSSLLLQRRKPVEQAWVGAGANLAVGAFAFAIGQLIGKRIELVSLARLLVDVERMPVLTAQIGDGPRILILGLED